MNVSAVPDIRASSVSEAKRWRYRIARGAMTLALVGSAALASDVRAPQAGSITVTGLRVEHTVQPLALGTARPRLRWMLESSARGKAQSAYQVLAASNLEKLEAGLVDQWDSGKVRSDDSVEVRYAGKALRSGARVYWKVRIWDEKDSVSAYSAPSFFETGLLNSTDWQGEWIGAAKEISAPLLRREFSIDAPVRSAKAYISGLGFHELSINGQKIGDRVLEPASSYYHNDQPFNLGSRVFYSAYDVTNSLKSGLNAIGVMLGHGWYSAEPHRMAWRWRDPYGDRPRLKVQLNIELVDGRRLHVVSDGAWKSASGPIVYNDLADGETYDAQLEHPGWDIAGFDDAQWDRVALVEAPTGRLTAQLLPPTRVIETLPVQRELSPQGVLPTITASRIYDFGQGVSGWTRITVRGVRGSKLHLRYAARVYEDNQMLDTRSNGTDNLAEFSIGARQVDTYVLKGEGDEVWEPRFTLHGFRFVEIQGLSEKTALQKIEGRIVHSALAPTGSFVSSNALLNRIHQNIQWTLRSGFQGIPQDAAERAERYAWLGDSGFTALEHLYSYDMAGFWEKWLNDLADSQREDGSLPNVSPMHPRRVSYTAWPTWQSAYPLLAWRLYEFYGDRQVLEQHYEGIKKLVDAHTRVANDDLVAGEPVGDHMEPQPSGVTSHDSLHTSSALTANAYHYFNTLAVARMAEVLGKTADARTYSNRAARIKLAFNRQFFQPKTNEYASGSQASQALPLQLRLVPEGKAAAVAKRLIEDIRQNDTRLTTGVVGTPAVMDALSQYKAASLLYDLATQTRYPSLGDQIAKGATTVCETYECDPWFSQNMRMFASWGRFLYRDLAGISPASAGYRRVLIEPQPVGDLQSVTATQHTVRGLVSVAWTRRDHSFDLKVSIPAGAEADIAVPTLGKKGIRITEGESPVWEFDSYRPGTEGLTGATANSDAVVFHAGSGNYQFTLRHNSN